MIDAVLDAFTTVLGLIESLFAPISSNSWGWAIITLTLIVRVLLLPLAIKQTRSMRAMQTLQPKMKELQKKYKVDRELMRKDPETYKARKAKLNEEMMELYKTEGANPAASCLPLLAQAPIFIALFWTLNNSRELDGETFYFFTSFTDVAAGAPDGLAASVSNAGWPGWLLILLMSGSMFLMQKQMMARNAAQMADNPMAQQQKILLYVMPIFLAVISFRFPLGILLYWVTTNMWQVIQQGIILREVKQEVEEGTLKDKPGGTSAAGPDAPPRRRSSSASSGKQKSDPEPTSDPVEDTRSSNGRPPAKGEASANGSGTSDDGAEDEVVTPDPVREPSGRRPASKRSHLPNRGGSARD
ncbi:MAG: membrane protein insertase YidC [Nitriliruptoraceae bacterium]|nr:membrane protein insertase YidC [Nitriliruptoraceae bacterium]